MRPKLVMASKHILDISSLCLSSHTEQPTLGRRETSAEDLYAKSELLDQLVDPAKVVYRLLQEAREEYRDGNLVACRKVCVEVLQRPRCREYINSLMLYTADSGKVMQSADSRPANYATIKALHLLSGTVPIDDSFRYLEHARQAIEGAPRAGDYEKVDIEMLQKLREQTAELWSLYEKERAGELSYPWPEPVRDQASGLFINFDKPRREHSMI
ncbi:hypothetical protein LTS12_026376 [Elasticomyces elasticus]|nr:hypothetical protein LTS12_026376 [Elasticomyces elasticus]